MVLTTGSRLDQYEILEQIGAGGMGVVYRARDHRLQRIVALKVLSNPAPDEAARQQLITEALATSALNHAHICVVHDVGESDGRPFIVMEFVDGRSLAELIPAEGLPAEKVIGYGVHVADALAHAHARGILHRDLKSSNVIVTREGSAKVVDFGLARRFANADSVSLSGLETADAAELSAVLPRTLAGTLSHMSPELLRGGAPSVASDIWSLGVLLHEMASGSLPFGGRTPFEISGAILHDQPSPLPSRLPPGARMIVARCLAKEPSERYHAAGEVRAALQAVQTDTALPLVVPSVPERRPWRRWGIAAALVAAAAAMFLAARFSSDSSRSTLPQGGRLTLIVGSERRAFDPALSPDGKMIAYVAEDERGRFDLVAGRVAGGSRVRLTDDDNMESHPRFAPDGERVMFTRRHLDSGLLELCVVPSLGGEAAVVLPGAAQGAWSPAGDRIAFIEATPAGAAMRLSTARPDGSEVRQLLQGDAVYPSLRSPTWSPDGRTLAFVRGTGGVAAELWLMAADGSNLRRLSNDPSGVFSDDPAFNLNGDAVLHSSNRGGATNLWSLPLAGGAPQRLTNGPGPDYSPTLAAGGEVSFLNSRWRAGLLLHDLASRETRTLTTHSVYLWAPAFSPNGREIAFSRSEADGLWHVWNIDLDSNQSRQLTTGPLGAIYPSYSSDGRSVIYHTWGAPRRVWRVPRAGGPAVALTPENVDATFADLSPDGSTLAFVATVEKKLEQVYVQTLPQGTPRLLTNSPASLPRWSPDGQWIAFAGNRGYESGLSIIRPDGTGERRLTDVGGWPVWWRDGRRIAYLALTPDGRQQIDSVGLDGSRASPAIPFRFQNTNNPFAFSADGRFLATSDELHVSDEIWLLRP